MRMKFWYNKQFCFACSSLILAILMGLGEQVFGETSGVTRVQSISPTKKVISVVSDKQCVISMAGGRGSAPYVAFPFLSRGAVSYTVTRLGPATFRLGGAAMPAIDSAEGSKAIARANFQSLTDGDGVLLKQVGIMRGEKVFSLIVLPYKYDSTTGQITYFKTVNVTLNSDVAFPSSFDNLSAAMTRNVVNQVQSNAPISSGDYIRIVVDKDGIYHITGEELDTAGVNLSGFTSQNMTLWNHGKQIPIYVHTTGGNAFTKSSFFEFYGTANRVDYSEERPDLYLDPFSNDNVYFLTKDSTEPAQRLVTENGALGHAPNGINLANYSFTETKHLEVDRVFERLDAVNPNEPYDRQDHWFWTEVSSQQMATEPFYLAYPDTTSIQPLTLRAAFRGITHFGIPGEHQAELFINNTHVLSSNWMNQTTNIVNVGQSANIPQNVLHNGYNNFEVYNANPGNVDVCTFAFNWVELHYQRLYVAHNDYLKFTVPDNAQPGCYDFVIEHFMNSGISVYRLNDSRITNVTIKYLNNQGTAQGYAALFEAYVQSAADQFIAVSDSGKLNPVKIDVVPRAGLTSHDYSANYIIIAGRQLDNVSGKQIDQSNPVSKLASWYNSHGVKTMVVNAVQVYDAFNNGIKSPHAIKSFISYAYHNWGTAPRDVLLVGAGTWDWKNGNESADLISVMMMQTYEFGAAASDNYYACVDGNDPIPDVAVGRIPATNVSQVQTAVDKILAYYSKKNYGWQNTALLIAGEEEEFHIQADSIVNTMIPPRYFIKRLYTSIQDPAVDTKYYGVTSDLVNDFNQAAVLVNYMGHGGGAIWADNGIMTNGEVSNLSNSGKYPFVTSLTCFAGAFDGQIGIPLCSTFLFAQNKGAVGSLASAGLGWMYNDYYMDSELLPLIFNPSDASLSVGTEVMLAKAEYYAAYSPFWPQAETMLNQYNIIGDPALVLQLPQNSLMVRLNSYNAVPGQNVSGSVANGPSSGNAQIQLTDSAGDVISQLNVNLNSSGSATFSIPYNGGLSAVSYVKAYAFNSDAQYAGSVQLSTSGTLVQLGSFGITSNGTSFQLNIQGLASSTSSSVSSVAFIGGVYPPGGSTANPPLVSLDIPLASSAPNEYSAVYIIATDSLKPGEVISGSIRAQLSDGRTKSSPQFTYVVPGAADISAYPRTGIANINPSMKVIADSVMRLEADVYDWDSTAAKNVRVDFYDDGRISGKYIETTRVSFDTTSSEPVSIPVTLSPGPHTLYMYVVFDSLSDGYDLNPANNFASNNVNVDYAIANQMGVVTLDSNATLSGAPPGEIFKVDTTTPVLYSQPLMSLAKYRNGQSYFYTFGSPSNSKSGNYRISLRINNPDSATAAQLSGMALYEYDPRTRTLNLVGGGYANGVVSAGINTLGTFAAAYSSNRTPPRITLSVGNQFFMNGDFVPPNPTFSMTMHDQDGVDLRPGSITVQVDGQPINQSLITIPDTVNNPTSITATVQLSLTNGSHTIEVTAKDANGNISNPVSADFVVQSNFTLRVYGAYPDPFSTRTFIAFEVTSGNPIDQVSVKIYTVSGRLVKTMAFPSDNPMEELGLLQGGTGAPTSVGYHEAWWEGTDNYGNQVANGVYFYKVSVTSGGKTLVHIGKMARLR